MYDLQSDLCILQAPVTMQFTILFWNGLTCIGLRVWLFYNIFTNLFSSALWILCGAKQWGNVVISKTENWREEKEKEVLIVGSLKLNCLGLGETGPEKSCVSVTWLKTDCPSDTNICFTVCLLANFCPAVNTISMSDISCTQNLGKTGQSATFARIFGLLACAKCCSFYVMEAIQCIMTKKTIDCINVVPSDHQVLLYRYHMAVSVSWKLIRLRKHVANQADHPASNFKK